MHHVHAHEGGSGGQVDEGRCGASGDYYARPKATRGREDGHVRNGTESVGQVVGRRFDQGVSECDVLHAEGEGGQEWGGGGEEEGVMGKLIEKWGYYFINGDYITVSKYIIIVFYVHHCYLVLDFIIQMN